MSLLGTDHPVMEYVSPEVRDLLLSEMKHVPKADPEAVNALLSEVLSSAQKSESNSQVEEIELSEKNEDVASAPESVYPQGGPGTKEIADRICKQNPQVIAFILAKLDEDKKAEIMPFIPDSIKETINENINGTINEHCFW